MTRTQHRLGLAAAVLAGCVALLMLLLALVARSGAAQDGAVSAPVVLGGLVAVLVALGWRAVTHGASHSDR